jgi:hypothetical protein
MLSIEDNKLRDVGSRGTPPEPPLKDAFGLISELRGVGEC